MELVSFRSASTSRSVYTNMRYASTWRLKFWICQRNLDFYYWRTAWLYTQSAKPRRSGYSITDSIIFAAYMTLSLSWPCCSSSLLPFCPFDWLSFVYVVITHQNTKTVSWMPWERSRSSCVTTCHIKIAARSLDNYGCTTLPQHSYVPDSSIAWDQQHPPIYYLHWMSSVFYYYKPPWLTARPRHPRYPGLDTLPTTVLWNGNIETRVPLPLGWWEPYENSDEPSLDVVPYDWLWQEIKSTRWLIGQQQQRQKRCFLFSKVSDLVKNDVRLKITGCFKFWHPSSAIKALINIDDINNRLVSIC